MTQNMSTYLAILIIFFSISLLLSSLRKKFIVFIATVLVYSTWGFLLDLDGIFLVFITAEFTIILLLLMSYLQLYGNFSFIKSKVKYIFFVSFSILILIKLEVSTVFFTYSSFYKSMYHIISSDFYILYYFLFEKLPLLVIFLTLIISFFSFFFIVLYFNLKLVKLEKFSNLKSLFFLKKQVLTKQTQINTKVYSFQN